MDVHDTGVVLYNESETKRFLEEWAKERGIKLDERGCDDLSGLTLCRFSTHRLMKLFVDGTMALGQDLFDDLHAAKVTLDLHS